ncbi:hypothetical protein ACJX0J_004766, partial [Zea mays]
VTNKNIYRESLLTSSKLENFIKIKYFVFLFNEYQADELLDYRWIKLYKESWFQRKVKWGYGEIGRDSTDLIRLNEAKIHNFFLELLESPILHCDKNSMNLMLFIK